MGSFIQAGFAVSQMLVNPEEITEVVGFMSVGIYIQTKCFKCRPADQKTGQSMGIVISLAIAGAIFQNQAVSNVFSILPNVEESSLRGAITGTDSSYFSTLSPSDRAHVISAIATALSSVYIVVIAGGATVVVIACFLPVGCQILLSSNLRLMEYLEK